MSLALAFNQLLVLDTGLWSLLATRILGPALWFRRLRLLHLQGMILFPLLLYLILPLALHSQPLVQHLLQKKNISTRL
ncbi:unnamed protein product [Protopolystoma xenopodis]|uniref:Uncharacterized protein n=1 Tax=Protopolystoma xenopodis TaxID=117903 RepID=A0A448XAK6_9PLAT|nr:unnamed protein product [Protopolystoma xenopodis]